MKHEVAKKRELVDERNLDLQSLIYQKTNLIREINQCKSFTNTQLYGIGSYPKLDTSDIKNYDEIMAWLVEELNVRFTYDVLGTGEIR
jgi:hypothetical protein